MSDCTIGIIGAGSMGSAIASGLVASGSFEAAQILACDHNEDKLAALRDTSGVKTFDTADELLAENPDVAILCVKPQVMIKTIDELAAQLADKLVISIAAGITLETLEEHLPNSRIARVMPNLPIQVRSGASAVALSETTTDNDRSCVLEIFSALGAASVMREDQLDVAGQSIGCSPALFALMVDCMTRAAVRRGLPAATARDMLVSTMLGTAEMLESSDEHPRAYMERVTSPGGTTIQFLRALEPKLAQGCDEGIDAALARNDELAGR